MALVRGGLLAAEERSKYGRRKGPAFHLRYSLGKQRSTQGNRPGLDRRRGGRRMQVARASGDEVDLHPRCRAPSGLNGRAP